MAMYAFDDAKVEKAIKKRQDLVNQKVKQIQEKELIKKNLNYAEELQQEIDFYAETRIPHFIQKQNYIESEIRNIEQQLQSFEDNYFADLQ